MEDNFIRERITELRIQKNVSEYKMSLDLGHSKSYIQSIVSGRSMPSMSEFLYICEYLGVSPKNSLIRMKKNPLLIQEILMEIQSLKEEDLKLILNIAKRLKTP